MSLTVSCADCVFFAPNRPNGKFGLCQRYPRHVDVDTGHGCGEHIELGVSTPSDEEVEAT